MDSRPRRCGRSHPWHTLRSSRGLGDVAEHHARPQVAAVEVELREEGAGRRVVVRDARGASVETPPPRSTRPCRQPVRMRLPFASVATAVGVTGQCSSSKRWRWPRSRATTAGWPEGVYFAMKSAGTVPPLAGSAPGAQARRAGVAAHQQHVAQRGEGERAWASRGPGGCASTPAARPSRSARARSPCRTTVPPCTIATWPCASAASAITVSAPAPPKRRTPLVRPRVPSPR